mgnify:CR=1 FL=1
MNQKEQIRKELNEYLDNYIPRTEIDIYKHVVDFIKKDRAKQLILSGVVKPSYCYCYEHSAKDEKCKTLCEDCEVYN